MSNIGAAAAASAFTPIPVLERKVLHTSSIVKIKIPVGAYDGAYPAADGTLVPYLQFPHNIRGGRVNFFVHTSMDVRGKTITATVAVMKKLLEDGREFLYIDLHPVDDEQSVTHKLAVMTNSGGSWETESHLTFKTPDPLQGVIILAPPEAKIVPSDTVVRQPSKATEAPVTKPCATGDHQLNRLLADGWEIDSEDSNKVFLIRTKGDARKTLTHHRPKKLARA